MNEHDDLPTWLRVALEVYLAGPPRQPDDPEGEATYRVACQTLQTAMRAILTPGARPDL